MTTLFINQNLSALRRGISHKPAQIIIQTPTLILLLALSQMSYSLTALANNKTPFKVESQSTATQHQVAIVGFAFQPSEILVSKGDTITWINKDIVAHSVMISNSGKQISPILKSQQIFTYKVDGSFNYLCGIHPSMKGKIIVRGSND